MKDLIIYFSILALIAIAAYSLCRLNGSGAFYY